MKRRLFGRKQVAMFVSMALVIGCFSSVAFADEVEGAQEADQQIVEEEPQEVAETPVEVPVEVPDEVPDEETAEPEEEQEIAEGTADETLDSVELPDSNGYEIDPEEEEDEGEGVEDSDSVTQTVAPGVFFRTGDKLDFGSGAYARIDDDDYIEDAYITGIFKLIYESYDDEYEEHDFFLEGEGDWSVECSYWYDEPDGAWLYASCNIGSTPWGVVVTGGDGTETSPFTFRGVVDLNMDRYPQEVTDGAGETWKDDDSEGLTFRVADPTEDDDEYLFDMNQSVLVDGIVLDASKYVKDQGSLIIKLNADYLKTLDEGKHTVTFTFYDGNDHAAIDTEFTVAKTAPAPAPAPAPQTGEYAGTIVLVIGAVMAAAGAAFVIKAKKA